MGHQDKWCGVGFDRVFGEIPCAGFGSECHVCCRFCISCIGERHCGSWFSDHRYDQSD
jgi:hypothetical protein